MTLAMSSSIPLSSKYQHISISAAGYSDVNGIYKPKHASVIPGGFDRTCREMRWDTQMLWNQLADKNVPWYEAPNESYIYRNKGDGKWWIDGPSGAGVYIAKSDELLPPKRGWVALSSDYEPLPIIDILEGEL